MNRLAQRMELDYNYDLSSKQFYTVWFTVDTEKQLVTVKKICRYKDKFDTQGQFMYQEDYEQHYQKITQEIEGWLW